MKIVFISLLVAVLIGVAALTMLPVANPERDCPDIPFICIVCNYGQISGNDLRCANLEGAKL